MMKKFMIKKSEINSFIFTILFKYIQNYNKYNKYLNYKIKKPFIRRLSTRTIFKIMRINVLFKLQHVLLQINKTN